MLLKTTMAEAIAEGLRPDRASSYNQVLTSSDGAAWNLEGSATDAEVTGPNERGTFAHTNNYVCDRMLPFEGDPAYAPHLLFEIGRHLVAGARHSET